ncbi:MAG: hypothetical protein HUK11_05995, partial [Muribaculaceae bacterium]|nr:hypothetical protein [Muribaculaceae bacterium]
MNNNIASLLKSLYEIEGLLLVAERRGEDTPLMVYQQLQAAARDLDQQCQQLVAHEDDAIAEPGPALEPEQPVVEVAEPVA